MLEEDPRSTPRWTAGSRPPTGSSGSCAARRRATPAPPATRASTRTAPIRRADYLAALTSGSRGFVADKLEHPLSPLGGRAGGADRRGRGVDRPARGHRGRGRQRRRARHRAGRAGDRARPDGRDHGHLDLPRHERRVARRGARDVRRRRRRHHRRACGATRPARAAWATSSAGSSTTSSPPRYHDEAAARGHLAPRVSPELAAEQDVGAARPARARLGERQPLGAGGPRAQRPARRADARHARRDVYRALVEATAFGARTIVETFEAAGVPGDGDRRRGRPDAESLR